MRRSEIFESFVKIAQEKGLISEAEHAEHTEKDFHETNPRHDSLTIEQIGKLYGNKPQMPEGMDYKKNIMEVAHPEPLVISPSYDKLNGLVESEIEGQNIRLRIVRKEPDGHLTQRKYAQKNLMLSLVRIANELDNKNQDELYKLADVCLLQASGQMKKQAVWGIVIGLAAALIAGVYVKQHLRFHSDGFERDYEKTIAEIDDLLNSNTNWGVGYAYTPEFIQTVNRLKTLLSELHTSVQKSLPVIEKLEKPRTKEELNEMVNQPDTQEGARAIEDLKHEVEQVYPFIQKIVLDFSNEGYKQRAIAQKGFLSSLVDAPEILHGGAGLVADDFDDVKHALQTLMVDLNNIVQTLRTYSDVKQQFIQDAQTAQAETSKMFTTSPTKTQTEDEAKPEEGKGEIGALEGEGEGLLGSLLGK